MRRFSFDKIHKLVRCAAILLMLAAVCLFAASCEEEEGETPPATLTYEYNSWFGGYFVGYTGSFDYETLTIPATYEGEPVVGVHSKGFENLGSLKQVIFETEWKMYVGTSAFRGCSNLESISFVGEGVEEIELDANCFKDCGAVRSISFTSGYVKNELYGRVFGFNVTLDELNVGDANITDITWEIKNGTIDSATVDGGRLTLHNTPKRVTLGAGSYYYCGSSDGVISEEIVLCDGYSFENSEIWVCAAPGHPAAKRITVPTSVENIPLNIFGDGGDAPEIVYLGTEAEWESVTVEGRGNGNYFSENYTVTFKGAGGSDTPDKPEPDNPTPDDPTPDTPIPDDPKPDDPKPDVPETVYCTIRFLDVLDNEVAPSKTVEKGATVIPLPPVREGYVFLGWSLSKDTDVWSFWNYLNPITSDLTVYAHFVDADEARGAELISLPGFTLEDGKYKRRVDHETSYIEIKPTVSPYADIKLFFPDGELASIHNINLEEGENLLTLRVTSGDDKTVNEYPISIYRNKTVTMTVKPENGQPDEEFRFEEGDYFDFPTLSLKGHSVNAWKVDPVEAVVLDEWGIKIIADCTVTPIWSVNEYTVSFGDSGLESVKVAYNSIATLPVPKRTNFRFLGWMTADGRSFTDKNGEMYNPYSTAGPTALNAKWEAIEYTVSYEGLMGATNTNPTSYTVNDANKPLGDVSVDWYAFNGWYTDRALTRRVTEIDTSAGGNITLYAGWTPESYRAEYFVDGTLVHTELFNINKTEWTAPRIPAREGYTAEWSSFTPKPENLRIEAIYAPVRYTITYLGIDGLTVENPESFTVEDEFELKNPEKRGYTFIGWYTADGKSVTRVALGTHESLTLSARWESAKYSITYTGTKGASLAGLPTEYAFADGEIALPSLTLPYYDFLGWVDESGNRITAIAADSEGDRVITASFKAHVFTITYAGIDGLTVENPESFTVEDEFELASPEKRGYKFLGWYTADGKSVTRVALGTHESLTLTARWESAKYSITYTGTKGASLAGLPTEYTFADGEIALPSLTLPYYDFLGWVDESGNRITAIAADSEGDRVITASFKAHVFTITYAGLDGLTVENPDSFTVEDEFELKNPEKRGYKFLGWYTADGKNVTRVALGTHESLTLTAKWELCVYKISYAVMAGIDTSGFVKSYTVLDGPITLPTVSSPAFEFLGWTLNGETVTVIPAGSVGDITLIPRLNVAEMTLVLETPYGSVASSVAVSYGESYVLPVPTAEGRIFLGWFDSTGESATAFTDAEGNSLAPYLHLTSRVLYAKFAAIKCTVSFDTVGGDAMPSVSVDYGSAFPDGIVPTKENAVFAGWYTQDMSARYTSSSIIKSNVTVYAKWITAKPISTPEELIAIANDPTGSYYLTCDINLRGQIWAPIDSFSGVLDGKGYTVRNFLLSTSERSDYFGFIRRNTGTVENLVFSEFTFNVAVSTRSGMTMGVFVGRNEGNVFGCVIDSGVIKVTYTFPEEFGDVYYGGFAGVNVGTVERCESRVDIDFNLTHKFNRAAMFDEYYTHYYRVGAVVGYNNGGTVSGCKASGLLDYDASSTGGEERFLEDYSHVAAIAAENRGLVTHCYSSMTVEASHKAGTQANTYLRLGTVVGYSNNATVENSFADGSLLAADAEDGRVGGLIGYITGTSSSVYNCYSRATVSSGCRGSAGGFVGTNESPVQNCYSTGDVTTTVSASTGGFVGNNGSAGTVTKCYSSGNVTSAGSAGGYFAGDAAGVLYKCFYLSSSTLFVNGEYKHYTIEHSTVDGKLYSTLWSEDFLVDTLYWDDEGWIILINEDPMLEWETSVDHNFETTVIAPTCTDFGYTVYSCTECSRFFVKDWVDAQGHDEIIFEIVEPTCTEIGYTSCYCMRCDESYIRDIIEPTGHAEGKLIEERLPDCTTDGYRIYECTECDDGVVIEILAATGHSEALRPAQKQTCESEGRTKEIYCSVCSEVLEPSRVIPPHNYRSPDTVIKEATCLEPGLVTKYCLLCKKYFENVEIPATGHVDQNGDSLCDVCGELFGGYSEELVIEIDTVEELLAISEDMMGTYRLTKDLFLPEDFEPIGSVLDPFCGYFDGNGHKLVLPDILEREISGVFGYNYGIITNLRVSGNYLRMHNTSGVHGGVAAYNYGIVASCELIGAMRIDYKTSLTSSEMKKVTRDTKLVYGGVVGINYATGRVIGCRSTADITSVVSNSAVSSAAWRLLSVVDGKHKLIKVETTQTLVLGIIVGENSGEIRASEIGGSLTHGDRSHVNGIAHASASHSYGYAKATTVCYAGIVAGVNSGTVTGVMGLVEVIYNVSSPEKHDYDDGWFFGVEAHFSFYDGGYVGENSGTVEP